MFLYIDTCVHKEIRYVKIIWDGDHTKEVITASLDTMRLKARKVEPNIEDPSVAEYEDTGNGEFRLKYPTGYLCRAKSNPGVIICKNSDDYYTKWKLFSDDISSKIKTHGLCLRRMGQDRRDKMGISRYLNASSCSYNQNSQWSIEDVEIENDDFKPKNEKSQSESEMLTGNDENTGSGISTIPATILNNHSLTAHGIVSKANPSPIHLERHILE